jgi:hypothetical protein
MKRTGMEASWWRRASCIDVVTVLKALQEYNRTAAATQPPTFPPLRFIAGLYLLDQNLEAGEQAPAQGRRGILDRAKSVFRRWSLGSAHIDTYG